MNMSVQSRGQFLPLTQTVFHIVCLVPLFTPGVNKDLIFDNISKFSQEDDIPVGTHGVHGDHGVHGIHGIHGDHSVHGLV